MYKEKMLEKKNDKVKEIQEYLEKKGIVVAETTIIDAAITIATRWGGKYAFVCELDEMRKRGNGRGDGR